ncbi:MAG TPA: ATP-binding protein [Vicinamibacterales bacterium]|nr:ATP-binding protein [Vicinamibacterales bacterium]
MEPTGALLIVEDDHDLSRLLVVNASLRAYTCETGTTIAGARRAMAGGSFHVALVDLNLGVESGLDVIRAIKKESPDTEIVVISATTSLASAIESYELKAFAFVPKPFDLDQLFGTVERAIEHRRMMLANRRLVWEQGLINDIGEELRALLPPDRLVERVLQRLMRGMRLNTSAARLLNPLTGEYDVRIISAPDDIRMLWSAATPLVPRPSDHVLRTRQPVNVNDLHAELSPEVAAGIDLRSALSVPMFVGDVLIGVLSVGSLELRRFSADDMRLLSTIANQVGVAIQNARLHATVRTGKKEWEATFDAISDSIGVFGSDGRLLRGNAALSAYLNRPLTSLRGLSCDEIGLCAGQYPDCAVGRASGTCCVREEVTRPDGHIFSVTSCPVLNASEGAAIVQIAKDVTHEIQNARRMQQMSDEIAATNARLMATVDRLKATQAQLLQAEKLSAIGELVAGVAHELNNPLTSVIGYAQLLQEEIRDGGDHGTGPAGAQLAHDLRRIAEESERAAKIVRNLLSFARRQSAAREPQDIADVVSRVLSLRAYEFRLSAIEVQTDFEPGLPPVLGDGGQLQQALLNLLLNAEQAMRSVPVRRIRVAARHVVDADAVELCIEDTGHGIAVENLRRIFDPFFTTRDVGEGTGLGLSICYGIIRDHGGQISVESRVGQGTMFRVLLPARAVPPAEPLRTLVAHHDITERDYLAAALMGWGHAVVAAETPKDALTRLERDRFDVALIDETMLRDADGRREVGAGAADRPRVVVITEAAGDGGVHPPFELSALRTALCGVKECV